MNTEVAFLAAMAADPGDDTARLAFADWLEENGSAADQARAEFIRLQCDPSGDTDAAQVRAAALIRAHWTAWTVPLAPLGGEIGCRRGFPHFLKADFARIIEQQALLGLAPDWHLIPTRGDGELPVSLCARLATGPFADRICGLDLRWGGWPYLELEAILAPTLVTRLRELWFGDDDYGYDAIDLLQRAPRLELETLGFYGDSYGGIGDEGCRLLGESARFASLCALELPNNDLTAAGVAALAGSPHLTRLRVLNLSGGSNSTNRIGSEGVAHLAGSATFRHLTDLNLSCNGIGGNGFRVLLISPYLQNLTSLNLPTNDITDACLMLLSESDGLPALNWLNVSGSRRNHQITEAGVARLARSSRMERLIGLKLGSQPIGDAGARALARSPRCRNLGELHVGGCGIGPEAFAELLRSPHLTGVPQFATSGNHLTKDDVTQLRAEFGDRVG